MIVCYLTIYILENIPFPFNNEYGFNVKNMKQFYQRDLIFLIIVGICPNIIDNMLLLIY
jgi:hypothetical protein